MLPCRLAASPLVTAAGVRCVRSCRSSFLRQGRACVPARFSVRQFSSQRSVQAPILNNRFFLGGSLIVCGTVVAFATSRSLGNDSEALNEASEHVTENEVKKKGTKGLKLFCGNANVKLAEEVAQTLGVEMGNATVEKFEDGEVNFVLRDNVRGKDVYIIQPTCTPVNENLMELMLMVSTLRRASARRITAVIPYYGYARQDRKMTARVPISAADVARLLEAMGVDRVIAVDLHCGQIQGFFGPRVPVDNLDGGMAGVEYFGTKGLENPVVVSPDAGGVYRAKKFLETLNKNYDMDANLAMIIKQRAKPGEIARMDLVGSVEGMDAIIVDDMIDTAGTLCKAAKELKKKGAKRVYAFASHGIFSGPAASRIKNSVLEEVCITNTIPLNKQCQEVPQIKTLSIAPLLAGAIKRIHEKKSVSELFRSPIVEQGQMKLNPTEQSS